MKILGVILIASGLCAPAVYGQLSVLQSVNPLSSKARGLQLYSTSVSSSYASTTQGLGLPGVLGTSEDAPLAVVQASASFGWVLKGEKGTLSTVYSPGYSRGAYGINYHSFNHSLGVSGSRTLTHKWSLSSSFSGIITDFNQLLFAPTRLGNISATPATFDELVAGMLTGTSTNAPLAGVIGAAPAVSSPEAAFLYGNRILSASATVSAAYAYSSRSTFRASLDAARSQFFNKGRSGSAIDLAATLQRTSSGGASLGWSYSLTPRTTAGVNVSSTRTFSRYQDAYSTQANVSLGRTINRYLFVEGSIGVGFITPIRATYTPTQNAQQQYGASLGYKVFAHTFLASYARFVSDSYGLGANATETSSGAWTWQRPGRSYSVSSSFGYSHLIGPAFPNSRSWTAQVGAGKSLASNVSVSVAFSRAQYPQSVFANQPSRSQTGVIVALSWSPATGQ